MVDFLGNEILLGDEVVFAGKGTKGYCARLEKEKVIGFHEPRNEVVVTVYNNYHCADREIARSSVYVVDITALKRHNGDSASEDADWLKSYYSKCSQEQFEEVLDGALIKARDEGFKAGEGSAIHKIIGKISENQMYVGITADYLKSVFTTASDGGTNETN